MAAKKIPHLPGEDTFGMPQEEGTLDGDTEVKREVALKWAATKNFDVGHIE